VNEVARARLPHSGKGKSPPIPRQSASHPRSFELRQGLWVTEPWRGVPRCRKTPPGRPLTRLPNSGDPTGPPSLGSPHKARHGPAHWRMRLGIWGCLAPGPRSREVHRPRTRKRTNGWRAPLTIDHSGRLCPGQGTAGQTASGPVPRWSNLGCPRSTSIAQGSGAHPPDRVALPSLKARRQHPIRTRFTTLRGHPHREGTHCGTLK